MRGRMFAFGGLLLLLAAHPANAQWTWKDRGGKTRTRAELNNILKEHRMWIDSDGERGTQANLSFAYLDVARLQGADLDHARLHHVRLHHARLYNANLSGADLLGADLSGADLAVAHLEGAALYDADLRGANLMGADLNGAHLEVADLTNAFLGYADLGHAVFEPKSLPDLRGIAAAKNLELLTYKDNPDALFQLRKRFADDGFREQERKITYALKRREAELSWHGCTSWRIPEKEKRPKDKARAILWSSDSLTANCGSYVLNRVFFDLTCQYGMSPGRPLMLGVLLWLVCSVLYFACIRSSGEAGLYRVYSQSVQGNPSGQGRVERVSPPTITQTRVVPRLLQYTRREWAVFRASMFFSLMSAFNIGFRDINFGRWLRSLTRQEFDIKAVGWARVISGWQSLLSVFFLALWVLSYFGRPFG